MKVLFLKDNKPGHYNQTEGLLLYLKDIFPNLEVEYIDVEIKSKLSRKILRLLLNSFTSFFEKESSLKYIPFFYKKFEVPKNKPDLIISTGGNVSNINAWFAKSYNCKNILNGALRGLKEELFTFITTVIDLGYKNQIILDVAPSLISEQMIENKTQEFILNNNINKNQEYYTLLIGGNGSGYNFDIDFYNDLISFVKKISKKDNIRWLITTSRRTPLEIEEKLFFELKDYSEYFVSYNKKEEKVMLPFLGLATKVFVTEESSSMISEAISSKKEVFTLGTKTANPDNNYQKILEKFENMKFIYRVNDFNLIENYKFSKLENINYVFINEMKSFYNLSSKTYK